MSPQETAEKRRDRLTDLCLELPEASQEQAGSHVVFRVRGRTFAYYLDDHHGDGMIVIHCKGAPGDSAALVEMAPERFHRPAYLGSKGWLGLRLDLERVDWDEVASVVIGSYRLVAPKRLARQIAE
jgi:phosphoribosylglycinamide formyltransferase-1